MPDFTFPVNDVVAGIFTVLGLDYPAEDTDVGSITVYDTDGSVKATRTIRGSGSGPIRRHFERSDKYFPLVHVDWEVDPEPQRMGVFGRLVTATYWVYLVDVKLSVADISPNPYICTETFAWALQRLIEANWAYLGTDYKLAAEVGEPTRKNPWEEHNEERNASRIAYAFRVDTSARYLLPEVVS